MIVATVHWRDPERVRVHLGSGGEVYEDDRFGGRRRILSYCLDDPRQGPVVLLPIFPVGASEDPRG